MSSRAEPPAADRPALERILLRDGLITGAALAAAIAVAWLWLVGSTAPASGMAMAMPASPWSAAYLAATFVMWLLMMVAMMLPSATPMILFYGRVARRSAVVALPSTFVFAGTYLVIWAVFSALATLLQAALVDSGAVSAMALTLGDRRLAGAVLVAAGLYQWSPLKAACLTACRSPLDFLMRLWRPGLAGALRLGATHGLYCLGCCWALMLLLFVGGVMNLAWIAFLAVAVLAEKLAPARVPVRQFLALAMGAGGAWLLATS